MSNIEIYKPEDCYDQMYHEYTTGKIKGTTTYNKAIDNAWTWRPQEFNIWSGYSNEGKLIPIDTKISTPNGFVEIQHLSIGDIVYDMYGKECKVTALSNKTDKENAYEMEFSDGLKVISGAPHQWVVRSIQGRASFNRQKNRNALLQKRRIGTKDDLKKGIDQRSKCIQSEIKTTEEIFNTQIGINNRPEWSIDLTYPVEYPKKDLIIDPYILGLWLGDGNSSGSTITNIDQEIIDYLHSKYTVDSKPDKKTHIVKGLSKQLKDINVLNNKHIPNNYLFSSIEDRLELLRGLMDSDGYVDDRGQCEFISVIPELSKGFCILATSLGIDTRTNKGSSFLYGVRKKDRYRTNFKTTLDVFKLSRKLNLLKLNQNPRNQVRIIKKVTLLGKGITMMCIEVDSPSHTYLCTEYHIPTHNSLILKQFCLIKALEENKKFIFSSPEDYPPAEFYDDMIHTLAGGSTDKDRDGYISDTLYKHCFGIINDLFHFVYIKPPYNTIESVLEEFDKLMRNNDTYGCIIDPILKFTPSKDAPERDDKYAAYIGSMMVDFARRNNISLHMVMHQLTPRVQENGLYAKPTMYNVKGGGSWVDGVDNLLCVQRPFYAKDKENPMVVFGSQKIKKQKLVGIPQDVELEFNRKTNRYMINKTDLFYFDKFL